MSQRVFISYSRADRDYVVNLAQHLAAAGIDPWYDHEIAFGDRFDRVIEQQIDECGAFIVIMSPDARESEWVNNELAHAKARKKRILPLLLRGEVFMALHLIDHFNVESGVLPDERFVNSLRAQLADTATAAATATPTAAPPATTMPRSTTPAAGPTTSYPAADRQTFVAEEPVAPMIVGRVPKQRRDLDPADLGPDGLPFDGAAVAVNVPSRNQYISGVITLAVGYAAGVYAVIEWSRHWTLIYGICCVLALAVFAAARWRQSSNIGCLAGVFGIGSFAALGVAFAVLIWRITVEHHGVGFAPPTVAIVCIGLVTWGTFTSYLYETEVEDHAKSELTVARHRDLIEQLKSTDERWFGSTSVPLALRELASQPGVIGFSMHSDRFGYALAAGNRVVVIDLSGKFTPSGATVSTWNQVLKPSESGINASFAALNPALPPDAARGDYFVSGQTVPVYGRRRLIEECAGLLAEGGDVHWLPLLDKLMVATKRPRWTI